MATITKTNTFSSGAVIVASEHNDNFDVIYNDYNGNITNANIAAAAAIVDTKLAQITTAAKVSGAALTSLSSIPSGAGSIPAINVSSVAASDGIVRGLEITDTSNDDTTVVIRPGIGFHGHTKVSTAVDTTLTFATAGDWYDGATDSYSGGAGWCYVGYNQDNEIKLLGANPPDVDDHAGHSVSGATKLYFDDSGGGSTEYWRVIGAVRIDTDDKIHPKGGGFQRGNIWMHDIPISMTQTLSNGWSGALSCASAIAATSTMGIFNIFVTETSAGVQAEAYIKPNGSTGSNIDQNGVLFYDAATLGCTIVGQRWCATDGSQQIQYDCGAGNGLRISSVGYIMNIR